ncbi:unnamed protein product [Closterium sp. NIES-53]
MLRRGCCDTCVVHRAWGSCLEDELELSSLVTLTPPGSSCEAEIYAGAMAAQELRWLTYLLTDLGEAPRSPPVLYVDNKAMLTLCQEHRLEHITKHIALRYFLPRELQQRGRLRLAYVASQANTADVFTKALQPCDHQPCVHCIVLQRFGFTYSSPQSTPLPTGHLLSTPPSVESVEPSRPYPELVGCLIYLMTCTRPDLAYPLSLLARYVAPGRHRKVHWDAAKRVLRYLCSTLRMGLVLGGRARVVLTGHADASWVDDLATQRSSQGYTFSLGSGSVSWRSARSSSVLSSSCEAEIYAGAMAAQELRWLTYLLTDLGEAPRSPPVLYVDNKAMLALCQEHRLEHITKHIALRYFLPRDLQQRGQLRLAYVASQANTANLALPFLTGLVAFCSPPLCLWGSAIPFFTILTDFFHTFSPTPKITSLRVLLHVAAQRDYELHSLDFSIAFLQGSLHEVIWLHRPPGFTGSFPEGTQWSLQRPVYGLR